MRPSHALVLAVILAAVPACQGDDGARQTATDAASSRAREADPDTDRAADYAALRAELCDTLANSFDCARAIETRRLDGAGWARRSGDTLRLVLVAGYGPNTLQIWSLDDDGRPVLEWETAPSQWGPVDGRWQGVDTLRLTQHGYCDQLGGTGRGMCDRPARAVREGGQWRFEVATDDA